MTTIRKLLTDSMRLNRVVAANEVPTDADIQVAREALQAMLDSMQADLLNIYTINPQRFLFTPGQQEYTVGPALTSQGTLSGADWITERPVRVEKVVILQNPTVTVPVAPEPPPEPEICPWVASIQDTDTVDLWLFNENVGSAETFATVSSGIESISLVENIFEINSNGQCGNGLLLAPNLGQYGIEDFVTIISYGGV